MKTALDLHSPALPHEWQLNFLSLRSREEQVRSMGALCALLCSVVLSSWARATREGAGAREREPVCASVRECVRACACVGVHRWAQSRLCASPAERCVCRRAAHIGEPGYFFPRKSNHSQQEYLHELSMKSGFDPHCPSAAHW